MKRDPKEKLNTGYQELHLHGDDATSIVLANSLLQQAEIKTCDLMFSGSNYVFLTKMASNGTKFKAVYKPRQGEAPLSDFPEGTLYKREYAAFIVSEALEWNLIPPTVIREGPYGIGSMQWFVDTLNGNRHYSEFTRDLSVLKQVALFDCLTNNADRKAGHFLEGKDGRLWVIDHGLTFNTMPKLRTVLWDFAGQTVPKNLMINVGTLQDKLRNDKQLLKVLLRLLGEVEVEALEFRAQRIIERPVFPYPESHRSIPWNWI